MLPVRRSLALLCFLLGLGALLAAALPAGAEPRNPPKGDAETATAGPQALHAGMAAAEVLERLGKPQHVARQVLYGRCVEQWTYDKPSPVRITLDWRKGQEKQIQTVQPLTIPDR